MNGTPAVITTAMMWQELQEIKKTLKVLTKNNISESIQEISFSQACKVLKLGREHVRELIDSNKLKARRYKDKNGKERLRIRIADIKEFQDKERQHEEVVQTRLEQESEELNAKKQTASQEFMSWAKAEVQRRQQQHKKGVKK